MAYEVRLENFSGPFDLLCHLIEARELDICAISLAAVVDQYLEYVEAAAGQADLDAVGEFLVTAARLLVLKARMLLPSAQAPPEEEGEESPEQLVDHLREYKLFRDAARELAGRLAAEEDYFSSPGLSPADFSSRGLERAELKLDPADLLAAWQRLAPLFKPPAPVTIIPDTPTVEEETKRLLSRLRRVPTLEFRRYLGRTAGPRRLVPAFLALLELWHRERVRVWQTVQFGEIIVTRQEDATCSSSQ
ncbi:MAG TPA: segregation/condensation protein A [Firmicutes bacterium]|nr:segregation/condensation protein A [Bacillota bacterium]